MKSKTLDWLPIEPPRGYKVASPPYIRMHGQGASVLIERIDDHELWIIDRMDRAEETILARLRNQSAPGGTRQSKKKEASPKVRISSSHRFAKQPGAGKVGAGHGGKARKP